MGIESHPRLHLQGLRTFGSRSFGELGRVLRGCNPHPWRPQAPLAQRLEQPILNRKVGGSNPPGRAMGSSKSELDSFNPNATRPQYDFATYIPDRRPQFKAHRKVNHARAAMTYHTRYHGCGGAILYQWLNGRWEEIERDEFEKNCHVCGGNADHDTDTKGRKVRWAWLGNGYANDRRVAHYYCKFPNNPRSSYWLQ